MAQHLLVEMVGPVTRELVELVDQLPTHWAMDQVVVVVVQVIEEEEVEVLVN
jgi:hypothetical protein